MSNNDSNTKVLTMDNREAMMMTTVIMILMGIAVMIKVLGEMI